MKGRDYVPRKNDIILDIGYGIYLFRGLSEEIQQIPKYLLKKLLKEKKIYFDRRQWGADHYFPVEEEDENTVEEKAESVS